MSECPISKLVIPSKNAAKTQAASIATEIQIAIDIGMNYCNFVLRDGDKDIYPEVLKSLKDKGIHVGSTIRVYETNPIQFGPSMVQFSW